MAKDQLRQDLLSKLASLTNDEIQALSFKLTHQLIKLFSSLPDLTERVGGAYLPLKGEIAPVYQELLHLCPVNLSYPVLSEGQMLFAVPNGIPKGTIWLKPPYSLIEPEWFLVPGVGFDLTGARLGRGKGYYDRYLADKSALKIGLAWSEQIVDRIPVEHHDAQMDYIITESFCWNVKQQEKF